MPPDLELLNRAVQAYQPNPRRVPFHELKPLHAAIVELRAKKASYAAIAELLQRSGVKTSRARVAEYGRLVLAGGKTRKRRKVRPHNAPPVPSPAPAVPLPPTSSVPIAGTTTEPRARGPRIAHVRMVDGSIWGEKKSQPDAVKVPDKDKARVSGQ